MYNSDSPRIQFNGAEPRLFAVPLHSLEFLIRALPPTGKRASDAKGTSRNSPRVPIRIVEIDPSCPRKPSIPVLTAMADGDSLSRIDAIGEIQRCATILGGGFRSRFERISKVSSPAVTI